MINDVLVRLREPTVSTPTETAYSSLIGKFVNDAKRQIEDAFAWNALGQTLTVNWETYSPGLHTIKVYGKTDECRSEPMEFKVFIGECSSIYIPNAFTPNDDGFNDTWYPQGMGWESIEVLVFDRWGVLVFKSVDPKGQWIGNFRGGDYYVQNDVYEYKVTWKGIDQEPEIIFGHVTVVR